MRRILTVDRISPVPEIKKVYPYDRRNKYRVRYYQYKGKDYDLRYCTNWAEKILWELGNIDRGDHEKVLENALIEAFDKELPEPKITVKIA